MAKSEVNLYRWESMARERVTDTFERRLITGDRVMLAHVYLTKGCVVPRHFHENEQVSYILDGELRFRIGQDGEEEITVRSGEVLHIPPNVPHAAEAMTDVFGLDVFSPPRQDWLNKTDDYLRR
jgi:quercetin dioxygenase-like cupin family protein